MTMQPDAVNTILVVDDEAGMRSILSRSLWEAGFSCATAKDGEEALALLRDGVYAIMLCDLRMPGIDGMEVLERARAHDPDMVVIMVTALAGLSTALAAIRAGAYDYLTKPFQFEQVMLAVRRALEHRRLQLEVRGYTRDLEARVDERTEQMRRVGLEVITSLGLALEAKDEWTHDHSRRVGELSAALAAKLRLDNVACERVRLGGMLHDIGKIGVQEAILHKPGPLTAEEYRHVQLHADLGARILEPLRDLRDVVPFIRHHHERWDGGGYPDGLAGEAIPLGARIVSVADAYVAMYEDRPYRKGLSQDRIMNELRIGAQRQFDLHVVSALFDLFASGRIDRILAYSEQLPAYPVDGGQPLVLREMVDR
jgi:putative two-component system response regulator